MKVSVSTGKIEKIREEVIGFGLFQGEKKLERTLKEVDSHLHGLVQDMLKQGDFNGKMGKVLLLPTQEQIGARRILLVGLGKKKNFSLEKLRQASGGAAAYVRDQGIETFTVVMEAQGLDISSIDGARAIIEGASLGLYKFDKFKTPDKEEPRKSISEITLYTPEKRKIPGIKEAIKIGAVVSHATNFVRDLVDDPANEATPLMIATTAEKVAKKYKLKCTVLNTPDLHKLRMGGVLAVSQGSVNSPKFVAIEYMPRKKGNVFCLVGKGVTFDSGGISIKPSKGMDEMKTDMGGAAAVLGTIHAAAELKLPVNIVGLMPLVENMPDGKAQRPGDIIKISNGKTVEVANTDAEGRLILADALSYAQKYKPKAIIDMATLTGACIVALGRHCSGMMGTDEELMEKLRAAGDKSGDRVWQLPLWDEYKEQIESDVADVRNIGDGDAGAITAGAFLSHFVGKTPWVHLDIAGPSYIRKPKAYLGKGATGTGVRLLTQLFMDWK